MLSRVKMAGSQARNFEEGAGLLANDDLYDAESDTGIHPTPEEYESMDSRPWKGLMPQRDQTGQFSRAIDVLTKLSLGLSGLSFLVLITALIIVPAGRFSGPSNWRAVGRHRTTGDAAIGLIISSIAVRLPHPQPHVTNTNFNRHCSVS